MVPMPSQWQKLELKIFPYLAQSKKRKKLKKKRKKVGKIERKRGKKEKKRKKERMKESINKQNSK